MKIEIKAFGIARDILGGASLSLNLDKKTTVEQLLARLKTDYPAFEKLKTLAIAINTTYAAMDQLIQSGDEVVIIPPVAGG